VIQIAFRKYNFKISQSEGKTYIFDEIRKKNLQLTPEEWVRQNIVHHLIYDLNYPKSRIAVEKEFTVNNLRKRFDILVYNTHMQPFMIVECKAPEIALSASTIMQVVNYNRKFNSAYIMITNGNQTYCFNCTNNSSEPISTIPFFQKKE
jgi:hypothetical protein